MDNPGPPKHIAEATAWEDVGISGEYWWTHNHPHDHPDDYRGPTHPFWSHRHEHRWEPEEDHHHPTQPAIQRPEAEADPAAHHDALN
jgi:hypothetical protein